MDGDWENPYFYILGTPNIQSYGLYIYIYHIMFMIGMRHKYWYDLGV